MGQEAPLLLPGRRGLSHDALVPSTLASRLNITPKKVLSTLFVSFSQNNLFRIDIDDLSTREKRRP